MSIVTQGYGDQGAITTQGYGAAAFTALPLVIKLAMAEKRADIDFTSKRANITFTGKRANILFTKVDC